jgi:deoxyribonuclease-1
MKTKVFYILFVIFTLNLYSQFDELEVTLNNSQEEYEAGKKHTLEFDFKNTTNKDLELIELIILSNNEYVLSNTFTKQTLAPNQSTVITFDVNVPQNIEYNFIAFIKSMFSNGQRIYIALGKEMNVMFENEYYDATYNLYGEELKEWLTFLLSSAKEYSYKQARNYIWSFDAEDNVIECVYTGKTTEVSFPPDFGELDKNGFNTEHTWPRAEGADDEPELSDMFHIYPTDKDANARRGNYAFGYVTKNVIWEDGGSQLGFNDDFGERFEPRDVHKGNVARSMFYFALRYAKKFNNFNFLAKQEDDLREWMELDPVDEKESLRNDSIFKYQENRNPFIDYPQFLDRINSISGDGDFEDIYDFTIVNDTMFFIFEGEQNAQLTFPFFIYNSGNREIKITEVNQILQNDIPVDIRIGLPATIEPGRTLVVLVEMQNTSDAFNKYEIIDDHGNMRELVINVQKTTDVNDTKSFSNLSYNYPNPFEEETTITIETPYSDNITVIVSDILGNSVNVSDNFEYKDGAIQFTFNPEKLSGNTFYYNVYQNGHKISNGYMLKN